jgi:hypothetical protein
MKVAGIIATALVVALLVAGPAAAQGKDPFRPPAGAGGSGTTGGGGAAPPGNGQVVVPPEPQTGGGLPRTGLDYSVPILASLALIAAGASMRLTSRALSP